MRTSLMFGCFAIAAMVLTGCGSTPTQLEIEGEGSNGMMTVGDNGGLSIDPNAATFDPNDPNVGAFGDGNFENRTPVTNHGLQTLYFSFDSYVLPEAELAKAEAAATLLLNNPSYVMIIEGHCDERGSNEYNLSLSEQRAGTVRDYILAYGIDPARLQTRAFGEEKPASTSHDLNRRAEFVPYQ